MQKQLQKQKIIKDDGRYLIYYAFDRPLPKVEGAGEGSKPGVRVGPEAGGGSQGSNGMAGREAAVRTFPGEGAASGEGSVR